MSHTSSLLTTLSYFFYRFLIVTKTHYYMYIATKDRQRFPAHKTNWLETWIRCMNWLRQLSATIAIYMDKFRYICLFYANDSIRILNFLFFVFCFFLFQNVISATRYLEPCMRVCVSAKWNSRFFYSWSTVYDKLVFSYVNM